MLVRLIVFAALVAVPTAALADNRGFDQWLALAEEGVVDAQFIVAAKYLQGDGVAKNEANAIKWFRRAAKNGHPRAQNLLGWMYRTGLVVEKDTKCATVMFEKAAAQGYVPAEVALEETTEELATVSNNLKIGQSFCGVVFGSKLDELHPEVFFNDGAKTDFLQQDEREYKMSSRYVVFSNSRPFRNFVNGTAYGGIETKKIYKIKFEYSFPRSSTIILDEVEFKETLRALRKKYGRIDSRDVEWDGDVTHTFTLEPFEVELLWIKEGFIDKGMLVLTATRKDLEEIANRESREYYDKRTQEALRLRPVFENDGADAL